MAYVMEMKNAKKKIQISIPHEGWIKPQLAIYLWDVLRESSGYVTRVSFYQERPIQQNYHSMVKDFLSGDADFLVILNADIVPTRNFLPLLAEEKDIIGLPTPTWKDDADLVWLIMERSGEGYKMKDVSGEEEWIECDAVGGGAMILSRKVLEAIPRPFEILWEKDGMLELGSDFHFCQRAKEKGFAVWTNMKYRCSHYGDKGNLDFLKLNDLLAKLQK